MYASFPTSLRLLDGTGALFRLMLILVLWPVAGWGQLRISPCTQVADSLVLREPGLEARVDFPVLHGGAAWCEALNTHIASRARTEAEGFLDQNRPTLEVMTDPALVHFGRWQVLWATSGLISLRHDTEEYTGGAHGIHQCEFGTLAWDGARLDSLGLESLLTWSPALEKALSRQLTGHLRLLRASEALEKSWRGLPARRLRQAAPTALGLLYVINEYEAGAYVEGAFPVLVPWRALGDALPAGGRLSRMLGE